MSDPDQSQVAEPVPHWFAERPVVPSVQLADWAIGVLLVVCLKLIVLSYAPTSMENYWSLVGYSIALALFAFGWYWRHPLGWGAGSVVLLLISQWNTILIASPFFHHNHFRFIGSPADFFLQLSLAGIATLLWHDLARLEIREIFRISPRMFNAVCWTNACLVAAIWFVVFPQMLYARG